MDFSYETVTAAAAEAIAEMSNDDGEAGPAPRRAVGAGVYLLWAHLVGAAAQTEDEERIMGLISGIA